jgi:NCS1 family nucleobase:cation symporter-1
LRSPTETYPGYWLSVAGGGATDNLSVVRTRWNGEGDYMTTTASSSGVIDRDYGSKLTSIEPGGVEPIPLAERHGSPIQLLWTWASPNLEFATVFVGVIGVAFFGLSFWTASLAILVGTALGALSQGFLSTWGPEHGLAQMILGRSAFGYLGNLLPAGLMSVTAGIGWFAVNSVSGAYALNTLTHLPKGLSLLVVVLAQIAVAFFGHNLVHVFEKFAFPFLAVVFLLAAIDILSKSHLSSPGSGGIPTVGAFLIEAGAAFGYAAGWNPYASDYTRYLRPDVKSASVALYSGLGIFLSCTVLEIVGAASVTIGGADANATPTAQFTGAMPTVIADLTLLAIALGAVSANVLNIYSGAMSFLAMGITLPFALRRAIIAVLFGGIGLVVAYSGLNDAGSKYENFLLVIAYWIGPWLGVVFTDRWLRRGARTDLAAIVTDTRYQNWAGPIAMAVGIVISVGLFSNQSKYVAVVPKHYPSFGDITFEVGFVISAALYYVLRSARRPGAV